MIGIPGDRRDEDQREYGRLAAFAFDRIIVREDANLRGRNPGEAAANVLDGVQQAQAEGARCRRAEPILVELDAARAAISEARQGDLVMMCVDDAAAVYREVVKVGRAGRRAVAIADPGEFAVEEG